MGRPLRFYFSGMHCMYHVHVGVRLVCTVRMCVHKHVLMKGCISLHHISVAGYCATLCIAFGTRGRHRRLVMHLMQCSEAIVTDSKLPFCSHTVYYHGYICCSHDNQSPIFAHIRSITMVTCVVAMTTKAKCKH